MPIKNSAKTMKIYRLGSCSLANHCLINDFGTIESFKPVLSLYLYSSVKYSAQFIKVFGKLSKFKNLYIIIVLLSTMWPDVIGRNLLKGRKIRPTLSLKLTNVSDILWAAKSYDNIEAFAFFISAFNVYHINYVSPT